MTNVTVPFGDNPSDTATLLLAAAEELDLDANVVTTNGRRAFVVPEEVNEQAFGQKQKAKPAAKKATKKAAAKKSTASTRSDAS